jgi:hypothetical protein
MGSCTVDTSSMLPVVLFAAQNRPSNPAASSFLSLAHHDPSFKVPMSFSMSALQTSVGRRMPTADCPLGKQASRRPSAAAALHCSPACPLT